ncbi:MAG: sensor histidine kinase [Candidatus Dormiibacterota bacterium]
MAPFSRLRDRFGGERRSGLFWSMIWIVYLALPVVSLWTSAGSLATRGLLTALLALFVLGYGAFWLVTARRQRRARDLRLMAAAALVFGLGLAVLGGNYGFGYVLAYVASVVTFTVLPRTRRAAAAILSIAAAGAAIGLLQHLDLWEIVLQAMIVGSSGGAMLAFYSLASANASLHAAREEIARLAVAEERLRFSRDLHDLLGHSLSVIVLKAELAHRMAERAPERTAREAADIERVAREALREVREAVSGYRQPSLSAELDSARSTLELGGMQVRMGTAVGALPARVDSALAWTVREATTNVIRHGAARRVRFEMTRQADAVQLEVVNDGPVLPPPANGAGNGLRGLRERARALGGELEFGPLATGGFSLLTSLPLAGEQLQASPTT